jgi:1-acyl-sn-glycerol-3-phosphate acyltransferase
MPPWLAALWYDLGYWTAMAVYTLGFGLRVEGRGNIPRTGPALLLSNHESYLDPLAVGLAAPRRLYYLARKTLFRNRLLGGYLRSVNCVPVDQEGVAKEGLKAILEQLQAGHGVAVFPEGERTWTGKMQALKPGVHLLIKRVAAPIVPIGISGAFQAMPRTRKWPRLSPFFWPRTGADLAVAVGKPLPPGFYDGVPRDKVLEDLYQRIHQMRDRAESLRRKS